MNLLSAISSKFQAFNGLGDVSASVIPSQSSSGGFGGGKWPGGLSGSGHVQSVNHRETRQNARNAMNDSVHARAIVERMADTVVDTGLRLEPTPNFKILGITPQEAEKWSEDVRSRFHSYANSKDVMRNGSMTLYQATRLMELFQQRDNDYFVRFFYSSNRRLQNPLQLEFIDPNQIQGDAFTSTGSFNSGAQDGIRRAPSGREIAYNVSYWTGKEYKSKWIATERGGLTMAVHGYQPEMADQGRGYSRLSHALQDLENATDFGLAHIKKAINQSTITMTVESESDAPASNPFEDIVSRRGARPISGDVVTPEGDGDVPGTFQDSLGFYEIPETNLTAPGSVGVFNLMGRERLKPFSNSAPSEHYESFINTFIGHISASMGIPIEVVLMKFNQNYSASRAALLLFWRVAVMWRMELACDILNPIVKSWMVGEIAANRIKCPGWQDPRLRAAWLACNWNGAPMPNIDPLKTYQADKGYVELGAQTLDMVALNYNGSNGQANRIKLTRELSELPIDPYPAGQKIDDDDNNKDDKKKDEDE